MKVLSLFSGIGAFEKALKNLEIPFELVGFSEIDKYAVKSYCAIHNVSEKMNFGDITKIDTSTLPKDIDLITYGFPCQDISIAGKQKGLINDDGTKTRSGLFFEALRIIEDAKPKIAIAENVKNLVGKKFNAQFQVVLASLEEAGYNNYWKVLNAKDFGIPQNRERVFIVSIRKDIDTGEFKFPEGFPLELRLKDMLEDEVDEKFYLSEKMIKGFIEHNKNHNEKGTGFIWKPRDLEGCASTLRANASLCPTDNTIDVVGKLNIKASEQIRRIYGTNGVCPTLDTMQGGHRQPKVLLENSDIIKVLDIPKEILNDNERQRRVYSPQGACPTLLNRSDSPKVIVDKKPSIQCIDIPQTVEFDKSIMTFEEKEGVFEKSERHYFSEGIAPTLTSTTAAEKVIEPSLKIRKLTPKECFRLMGFDDADFTKAEAVNSNTQLYKQAGNSIVVDVIVHIFTYLFKN